MGSPAQATQTYIRTDEFGTRRVGKTRVSLDSVVAAFQRGDSPESIQQQYSSLTLEEVYGAITHYLANQTDVDAYLENQRQVWERERAKADANPSPAVERLRKLKAERQQAAETS